MGERDGREGGERQTDRQTDRQRQKTERDKKKQREQRELSWWGDRQTDRQTETDRQRQREMTVISWRRQRVGGEKERLTEELCRHGFGEQVSRHGSCLARWVCRQVGISVTAFFPARPKHV